MLAPKQMTDDTLAANIRLYREIERTQPDDLSLEEKMRYADLVQERDERMTARDALPDGIYVTSAWAEEPHKGLTWRRANGRWARLTTIEEHAASQDGFTRDASTPQVFYGLGWEKQILPLAVVRVI